MAAEIKAPSRLCMVCGWKCVEPELTLRMGAPGWITGFEPLRPDEDWSFVDHGCVHRHCQKETPKMEITYLIKTFVAAVKEHYGSGGLHIVQHGNGSWEVTEPQHHVSGNHATLTEALRICARTWLVSTGPARTARAELQALLK